MILIDTSAFIKFLNHTGSHFDREIEMLISNDDDIAMTGIILTEILQGIKQELFYKPHERLKRHVYPWVHDQRGVTLPTPIR